MKNINILVYSREAIENTIADGNFPENTAVISFYDPVIKRIDKNYSHVDYSGVCDTVFYSELDDLDLEVLKHKGYTYDTYFPEADDIAEFIVQAYMKNMNIICQCEYGQSRSAGCAAAILEYFYHQGIYIFTNYEYYPNQVVYHKIFDALVKLNPRYTFGNPRPTLELKKIQGVSQKYWDSLDFYTGATTLASKILIEKKLTELHLCYNSFQDAMFQLRHGKSKVYVSLHIDNATVCHGQQGEHCVGVKTYQQYEGKEVALTIYFSRFKCYTKNNQYQFYLRECIGTISRFCRYNPISFDILGILETEYKEPIINNFILTNLQYSDKL